MQLLIFIYYILVINLGGVNPFLNSEIYRDSPLESDYKYLPDWFECNNYDMVFFDCAEGPDGGSIRWLFFSDEVIQFSGDDIYQIDFENINSLLNEDLFLAETKHVIDEESFQGARKATYFVGQIFYSFTLVSTTQGSYVYWYIVLGK